MTSQNLQTRKFVASALLLAGTWQTVSCNKGKAREAQVQAPAAAPAGGVTLETSAIGAQLTPDYLDELLAPIALYPDVVLMQILTAAANPQEVLDAGNWLIQNSKLNVDQRIQAAKQVGFGPSIQALVQFPEVVDMMCRQMDWTKQLGEAFKTDQKAVMASAQRLRVEAVQAGSLQSTPQQTVTKENQGGQTVVVVQPANPQVVYVPQYDPEKVYSPPPQETSVAPASNDQTSTAAPAQEVQSTQTGTTESTSSGVSTGTAVMASLLSFGVGVALGSALHHDDYYYPNWGYGAAYYGPRPYVPAAYVYRPVYGPAFRPAGAYYPPAGYRYAYNLPYGGNNNVVVNQNNYYNRFSNNQNLVNRNANLNRTGYNGNLANNRPGAAGNQSWRGQNTYAGANRPAGGQTLANNRSESLGANNRNGGLGANRNGNSAGNSLARRTANDQPGGLRANRSANSEGNALGGGRTANAQPGGGLAANRPANASGNFSGRTANAQPARASTQPQVNRSSSPSSSQRSSVDRGFGGGQAGGGTQGNRSSAFSGGSAREERAASDRGRQSISGGGGNRGGGGGRRRG